MAIVDLALPAMNGWELLKRIKGDPLTAHIPCFAITAFHSSEVALEAQSNGFAAYFRKPLDPLAFVQEITRAVAASGAR